MAAIVAALTVALFGAGLRLLARTSPGEPPFSAYPQMDAETYRYNATTGKARSEIALIGSSLMRYGIQEKVLTRALGEPDLLALNLALDAASPWEELRLIEGMVPSRARNKKIAIVEINRISMDASTPLSPYGAMRLEREGVHPRKAGLEELRESLWTEVPPRQDLTTWLQRISYGAIGPRIPGLIRVPPAPARTLWTVNEMARRRAVQAMTPHAAAKPLHDRKLSDAPHGLRLAVAALKRRGFRVMLLQTPLHSAFFDTLASFPGHEEAERAYRAAVLDPQKTGADEVLAFDRAAEIGGDDTIFVDYGHMTPEGSTLLTERVAEHLRSSAIFRNGSEESEEREHAAR